MWFALSVKMPPWIEVKFLSNFQFESCFVHKCSIRLLVVCAVTQLEEHWPSCTNYHHQANNPWLLILVELNRTHFLHHILQACTHILNEDSYMEICSCLSLFSNINLSTYWTLESFIQGQFLCSTGTRAILKLIICLWKMVDIVKTDTDVI